MSIKKIYGVILVIIVFLLIGCKNWIRCDSPMRQIDAVGIYRVSLEADTLIDFTDTQRLSIFEEFHTFDYFRYLSLDLNATVMGGNVYVVIYDVTDSLYTQDVSELMEVKRLTIKKNGDYSMNLLELPINRQYAIGFFCDEECMFTLDSTILWKTTMKEYIHDMIFVKLFNQQESNTPKSYKEYEWYR